ncbi:cell wall-binding repeat-containing protein [Kineococcus sp. SYSU DK004]|uniref:cell wall-binding repeat-containing protein n=1 Tax=Kineococcus sp. SYSU DK004 TaxID=3383125 RepID=UPI003D7D67C7
MQRKKIFAVSAAVAVTAGLATAGSAVAAGAGKSETARSSAAVQALRAGGTVTAGASSEATTAATDVGAGAVRLSGRDRYETAADVAGTFWDAETTAIVYLASGTSSADALSLGPSTMLAGPLLLTERDRLPEVTRAELVRLEPCFVVVAGGAAVVSDAVVLDAERYADPAKCGEVPTAP